MQRTGVIVNNTALEDPFSLWHWVTCNYTNFILGLIILLGNSDKKIYNLSIINKNKKKYLKAYFRAIFGCYMRHGWDVLNSHRWDVPTVTYIC